MEEQKAVLLSASKLSGCYTEGVVLSKKLEVLFRGGPAQSVPGAGDDGEGGASCADDGIRLQRAGGGPPGVLQPDRVCCEPSLFTLLPQGVVTLSETDAQALATLCQAICTRLAGPVRLTAYPHRIGRRTSVALHMEGHLGRTLDVLITVTGSTLWPQPEAYDHPQWYVTLPDAADVVYLLLYLNVQCEGAR